MNSLSIPVWAEAYRVNFENLGPGEDLSPDQRKLVEILVNLGIFICEDLNKEMIRLWDEIEELKNVYDFDEGNEDVDEFDRKLDEMHSGVFKIHKFCQYLIENFLTPDQNPAGLMDRLQTRAPLTTESDHEEDSDDWLNQMTWADILSPNEDESSSDGDSDASNLSHTSLQEAFEAGAFDTASDDSEDEVAQYFNALSDSE